MKLVCRYCQYRFETKRTSIPKLCPYCGQKGTLEKEKDADSLLHEVEEDEI
jgi:rRNA maturation endonuclease Nob1